MPGVHHESRVRLPHAAFNVLSGRASHLL